MNFSGVLGYQWNNASCGGVLPYLSGTLMFTLKFSSILRISIAILQMNAYGRTVLPSLSVELIAISS